MYSNRICHCVCPFSIKIKSSIMSNNQRLFGLRCREKLKLKSQKVCEKCNRYFFPSSYSENDSDIEDNKICNDCNTKHKSIKKPKQKPPLPSIAHQSSKLSIPAIRRKSNNEFPAFNYIIPATVSQKTSNNTAQKSSSTIENDIEPPLISNVPSKRQFTGTIECEGVPKRRRAANRSITLSSGSRKLPEPDDENEHVVSNIAAISYESMPSLDPIDNFVAALPINNNNNRTKRTQEKKQTPTHTNNNNKNNLLEPTTRSVAQVERSVTNIQPNEQICSTSIGANQTNTKFVSTEPPARVSARIRKKVVPFGLKWSPALPSGSNKQQQPAKKAKIQRTSKKTQPNEENAANSDIQHVPIDQMRTDSTNAPKTRVDILDMIVIHSRVHPSKEQEITSSKGKPDFSTCIFFIENSL